MEESLTSLSEYPLARDGIRSTRAGRLLRPIRVLSAAAGVLGAAVLLYASEPSGHAIRRDLVAAASRLRDVPDDASAARVTSLLSGEFTDQEATIDPSEFPAAVAVTLHSVDRADCLAALRTARRMEGRVVVALQGYPSSTQCADSNDMTWRLMP